MKNKKLNLQLFGNKLSDKADLVFRHEKVAFMQVDDKYVRMEGFTDLTTSKEVETEERKYVDEKSTREFSTSVKSTISYEFDDWKGHEVLEEIKTITNRELIGTAAVRSIIVVDLSADETDGAYPAIKRDYTVVPSDEGSEEMLYNYTGEFVSSGDIEEGFATSDDEWETATFKKNAGATPDVLRGGTKK